MWIQDHRWSLYELISILHLRMFVYNLKTRTSSCYESITSCIKPSYDDLLYDWYIQYIIIIRLSSRTRVSSPDRGERCIRRLFYVPIYEVQLHTPPTTWWFKIFACITRNKSLFRCLPRWQSLCNILLLFMWLGVVARRWSRHWNDWRQTKVFPKSIKTALNFHYRSL